MLSTGTPSNTSAARFPRTAARRAGASVEGVRTGNVVAFGIEGRRGKEAIVVVAETRVDAPDQLRDEVVDRVCDVVGIPPLEVRFVAPGSLPKTSSGKLQRSLCR